MNIAVLIKMVPDTESRLEIVDGKVKEDGFKYMVNPYDEFAVEQAVQFKENVGGKVTLVCLFSNNSGIDTDLRKMMAIGADEAIVLRQDEYQGDKPSSNSKLLAEAVKELNADLVIGGVQGIDYYQGATGPMVAHHLNIPHISGVTKLELNGEKITASRQIEGGLQIIESALPVLVTAQKDMTKVRFPALKDIMMSKRKPFENRNVNASEDIDVETIECSLPPARGGGLILEGETPEEKVDKLIEKLKMEAKVL
jgi:electron transfer flavoprotein beta subunit